MTDILSSIDACLLLCAAWCVVGLAGLLRPHSLRLAARILFPIGALIGLALAIIAIGAIGHPPASQVLRVGLPDLPAHARLDGLSCVFLALLGLSSTGISLFSSGYFRHGQGTPPGLLCLQYHLFLASMGFVVMADDAYAFMLSWETMALTSYFLVTTQHRIAEIRSAGFIYLLIAHVGAIGILLCFGILQGGSWQFTFAAMREAHLSPAWSAGAFLLAMFGFGAKAGLVPLHIWLPDAHPAAPSPVSALMSGVMLKTAVYGILRVSFDLIRDRDWWWGLIPLAIGLFTALFGVIFAAVQTDMKRLLAYSSIENVGLLFVALGLAIVFGGLGMTALASLAIVALLYHAMNHAFMKSLLFLGTGAVLHATGERNLGRLGGLVHRMPWVAGLTLVGVLAIAGLPPLNGFVSEWLLLQALLFSSDVPKAFVNMLLPLAAALVALAAALAAYVMVKFYGIVFLGQPREPSLAGAHDAGWLERAGMLWLALGCVALGLAPTWVVGTLSSAVTGLGFVPLPSSQSWLFLGPVPGRPVSYSPLAMFGALVLVTGATWMLVRVRYHGRVRRGDPWDCGFVRLDSRMQDTAEGFGQPIRHLFEPFFEMQRELPTPFDEAPRYRVVVTDRFWNAVYRPIGRWVGWTSQKAAVLQQGRIAVYLAYSFVTLLVLLAVAL
jgi:hydrogenase-4 component B